MPKEDELKEVRERKKRVDPDESMERHLRLSGLTIDELQEVLDTFTERAEKARKKYGYGINDAVIAIVTEDPRIPEEEFWAVLEKYWDSLTSAARKRCREQKPPPLICDTAFLGFRRKVKS